MPAYYNDNDPFAVEWLKELVKADLIAPGEVDNRSIEDVRADELRGFTQCHFFAGIGVWSYALRQAGWSDDQPVWTGSCPCQPFSVIARGRRGTADDRHLWPTFRNLIAELRPPVVFGEQVSSKDGRHWLDGVCTDLEALGFAFGAADMPAAGLGGPHIRQRFFWVGDSDRARLERYARYGRESDQPGRDDEDEIGPVSPPSGADHWNRFDTAWDTTGARRRVEPGSFPLANGITNRVGRLRGYGNALVAPVAQGFIEAYLEASK